MPRHLPSSRGRSGSLELLLTMLLAISMLFAALPAAALAEIPDVTWEPTETVDAPVADVSTSQGNSVLHAPLFGYSGNLWHAVYVKSGHIYHRARHALGWTPPVQISDSPGLSLAPTIASTESFLHVVWEDDRTGHPEVWTRKRYLSEWLPEQCLTCDGIPSRNPVIDGAYSNAFLAWEEGPGGSSQILGRVFRQGAWQPVVPVSTSPAVARDPSVSADPWNGEFNVAWADTRDGEAEIYYRLMNISGGGEPVERLTNLPGACARPSIHEEICCGDWINPMILVAFENDGSGTTESYGVCHEVFGTTVERLSPEDGVPSERPNVGGFTFGATECGFGGGVHSRYFTTWTDRVGAGLDEHSVTYYEPCISEAGEDIISDLGASFSVIGATEGEPEAEFMVLWVEDVSGVPTLLAKRANILGCYRAEMEISPSFLIAPEGVPSNLVRVIDACTDTPIAGRLVDLSFPSILEESLTWDSAQPHPPLTEETDAQGEVIFSLRGGGCSQAGPAYVLCGGIDPVEAWPGVKSPDMNGNCAVDDDDLARVQSKLGTSDFCADLDGSGLVDAADVAIVEATRGDHCSQVTATGVAGSGLAVAELAIFPNPCRDSAALQFRLAGPIEAELRILDMNGRLVRDLGHHVLPAGVSIVSWDTRDPLGRLVPAGIYVASARALDGSFERSVLVLR